MTQTLTPNLLGEWYARVTAARPFIKWAGGKSLFLKRYGTVFPPFEGRYFEPFLGSGAAFFYIQRRLGRPVESVLSDQNAQLILMYRAVKELPEELSPRSDAIQLQYNAAKDKATFYYEVRERYNGSLPTPSPADLIFLNRTCWNGLYRVNRQGKFNVPYGTPRSGVVVPTISELLDSSAALLRARLRATSRRTQYRKHVQGTLSSLTLRTTPTS